MKANHIEFTCLCGTTTKMNRWSGKIATHYTPRVLKVCRFSGHVYDEKQPPTPEPRPRLETRSGPSVYPVSGGLPTLGKGHR